MLTIKRCQRETAVCGASVAAVSPSFHPIMGAVTPGTSEDAVRRWLLHPGRVRCLLSKQGIRGTASPCGPEPLQLHFHTADAEGLIASLLVGQRTAFRLLNSR